jgi:hypothetical protein
MSELYTGRPLFPGTGELNQLITICEVKGTITQENWIEGVALAHKLRLNLPIIEDPSWNRLCEGICIEAIQLMEAALAYDSSRRVTAKDALSYPLFDISLLLNE